MFRESVSKDRLDTSFSVIIACRNEESNLPTLFASLEKLKYPNYEIILIDDASQDSTLKKIKEFCLEHPEASYIHLNSKSKLLKGKKAALQAGADLAKHDFLLFTDADCQPPQNWLQSMNKYTDNKTGMVVGYSPERGVNNFRHFTQMMSAATYAVTIGIGLPFSCSGRNLAVNKKAFEAVNGYQTIGHFQAGDDKLLLKLISKTKFKIKYNPKSAVYTKPQIEHYDDQQKRRYGKFTMSSVAFQIISFIVFAFYIYLPVKLITNFSFLELGIYYCSALFLLIAFLVTHNEKFKLEYCLYTLVYPYYLIYYSVKGSLGKWKWKS